PKLKPTTKRKRRVRPGKRRLNWGPVWLLAAAVNIGVACAHSKVTSVRAINTVGVRNSERERVARLTEQIKGIPALQVDPFVAEGTFLNQSRVASVDFRRNFFGIARLTMTYREPVASIKGSPHTYLAKDGTVFDDPEVTAELPILSYDPNVKLSLLTLSEIVNGKEMAGTILKLKHIFRNKRPSNLEIQMQDQGGVCLNMDNGVIVLGSSDQMDEKLEKVRETFEANPDLFKTISILNLMTPERPMKTERGKPLD
ncbi:MAG TPA: hypothetical protein VK171_11065, partial [Fimbriimonas sp.]|nr:hypothetical protein [Fimbriimonas sp.]